MVSRFMSGPGDAIAAHGVGFSRQEMVCLVPQLGELGSFTAFNFLQGYEVVYYERTGNIHSNVPS